MVFGFIDKEVGFKEREDDPLILIGSMERIMVMRLGDHDGGGYKA